jgi:hypothetical protein
METTIESVKPFVEDGEIQTPFMVYTSQGIIWGKLPHSELIQPSRILVGVTVPEYVTLLEAQVLFLEPNFAAKPIRHAQIMVSSRTILGYNLMPPQKDQLDYDPTEPNRRMTPVTLYMGALMVKGSMRISEITSVKTTVEVTKADFVALYDIEVCHPNNPKMSPIKSNMGYFRLNNLLIAE